MTPGPASLVFNKDHYLGLRGKAGKEDQPVKHARKQGRGKMANKTLLALKWPFLECLGPRVREQASPYLCVFRAENSSEMICFKKLKQKKKI